MYDIIKSFPDQVKKGMETRVENFDAKYFKDINKIVFIGMGDSGIVGNIIRDLIKNVPIFVSKNYEPPDFIDKNTLVICVSYSGNTKETLESYHKALKKNCRVLGVASGGKLLELLVEEDRPHIKLPSGVLPRCSIHYQLFSILGFLEKIGHKVDRDNIVEFAKEINTNVEDIAIKIAKKIGNKMVFIYSTMEPGGLRFKTQLNETAKIHSKNDVFPEMNHNEVVAWQNSPPENTVVTIFRYKTEKTEILDSIEFLKKTLNSKIGLIEVILHGETRLQRMIYFIVLGDMISYYLAKNAGIDPEKTEYIYKLKEIIKE